MAFSPSRSKCSRTMASWGWLVSWATASWDVNFSRINKCFQGAYDAPPVIDSLMQVEKKTKELPRNPSVSIGFYQLSHLAGTADLCHTLTAGCLSCGMMGRTLGWQKDASLSSLHIWVVHLPVFYFYVTSIYVFGDALVDSSTSLSVHGRYFLVSVRVSVVASCSFLCSQLSSYIVFLPAFQSTYLTVYLSTCRHICLPIYLSIIDLSTISISTVLLTDHLLICSSAFTL